MYESELHSAAVAIERPWLAVILSLLMTMLFSPLDAVAVERGKSAGGQSVNGGASMAPGIVTPGRPHASSSDPHRNLSPEKMVQVALQHKAEGRAHEALNTLNSAIARFPGHARLYSIRGSIYLEQSRPSDALIDLERTLSLKPDDAAALTNRAQVYRQFGRTREALRDLDRAVELNPNLIPALFNRGVLRYSEGDLKGARADFDSCIAIDPHIPAPYFNRGAVNDAMGDRTAAIADIERFIQIAKNDEWRRQGEELLKYWKENPLSKSGAGE